MVTLELENNFLGEAYVLKVAVEKAIKSTKKDISNAKKMIKIDPDNKHVYEHAIEEAERLFLNPAIKLFNKKIKNITE